MLGDLSTIVSSASQQTGVPASLISSVIGAESAGNPLAVSSTGAQGLMQLMPSTGQQVAGQLGISNFDPFDPAQNVTVASTYLGQLFSQFGDWATALAAFNWGPGNVSNGGNWPSSTQSYVSKVLNNAGLDSSAGLDQPDDDSLDYSDTSVTVMGVGIVAGILALAFLLERK